MTRRLLVASLLLACLLPVQAQTPPQFTVSPARQLNFGKVKVGKRKVRWFTLRNRGGGNINVSWNARPSGEFSTRYGGIAIGPNEKFRFECDFSPPDKGRYEAELVFTTDDPQRPEVTLLLTGTGYFRQ